ncbi:uncharacterized protein BCR38DRAFT_355774 [Pseudomassariella vexata]|uniref:G-protein coupled receptors family 2 profile 2 domain-containing protein n=1 Tax=Pseudomassariella vexata TaxID=1141098 RepID=A0A1Y2DBS5_9PEZI|nr:uncharacterized protein BCR38DRAFT_355774 [Pseudomassariella vexata]ORY56709.1 hypothetical protein BCR38DRAFT_355774 [Pseudomassariella vexata]
MDTHRESFISSRVAIEVPRTEAQNFTLNVVMVVVSLLSMLGSVWIILSFACFKSLRSFRHELILGLAVSTGLMALNILSSACMKLAGNSIGQPSRAKYCSFNGFVTQAFVFVIAICSYFILVDCRRAVAWVHKHSWFMFLIPWILSCTQAIIELVVVGYGDIGVWCWFTSDKTRLFVNYIPRWLIIMAMLAMYTHLYFFFRKAHNSCVDWDVHSRGAAGNLDPRVSGNEAQSKQKLKKLARLMLIYPFAYILIWILPTGIRIYQATKEIPAPFALQTLDKSCIVIQGFIDAVIYGVTETSLSSWKNLIFPDKFPFVLEITCPTAAVNELPRMPRARLNSDSDKGLGSSMRESTISSFGGVEPRDLEQGEIISHTAI